MVKVENKKYVAEIDKKSSPDYVTFWGKIKGDIYKQTDLIELLNKIKTGFNSTIDGIKAKLYQLSTINDGKDTYQINKLEVEKDSEGDLQNLVINTTNNISVTLPIRDSETLVDKEDFESTVDEINERITEVENSIPTSTSQLVNDGDGTSQFATQEYVSENGGKIDKIEVNGVEQEIINKTVNINIVNSPLTVHMIPEDGSEISDKTFGEIKEAFDSGKSVIFFSYSEEQGSIESTSSIMTYYSYSIHAGDYPSASGSVYTGAGGSYNILIDHDPVPQTVEELDSCYLYMPY